MFFQSKTTKNNKKIEVYNAENNFSVSEETPTKENYKTLYKTIKKVEEEIERHSFNTVVSTFMICVNELTEQKCKSREIISNFTVLLSSYAPHISEEIWQQLKPIHKSVHASIMIAPYPSIKNHTSAKALKDIEWIKDIISGLRNIRGELKIKPSIKIECLLQHGTKKDKTLIEEFEKIIVKLAGLKGIKWISSQITPPPSSLKVRKTPSNHRP